MLDRITEGAAIGLAERTTRRSFFGKLGAGVVALVGGPFVAVALRPDRAEAHHICGHTFTTGSCPHPFSPYSRVDRFGYPVHPTYGYPVDDSGNIYKSRKQRRRRICEEVVPARYPRASGARQGGGWSRCCNGRIRRIYDCCSYSDTRIQGDAAVTGYCFGGRKVFCIGYRDLKSTC
ncbi:MAG: twin-arginine translocation signal domain-containing protein [Actinomycetota bacterium]|nr:twin-arginine translocation signal domain-containing protein [Actinomycetota bacterium]